MWARATRPRFFFCHPEPDAAPASSQTRLWNLSGDFMDANTQTALITGASGGIGYELAKLFARDKYNLVLVARSADKLNRIANELQSQFGVNVKTVALDLASATAPKFLF